MILFTAKYAWHSAYTHARTRSLFLSLSLSFIHTQKRLCVCWNGFLMTRFLPTCFDKNPTYFPYTQICLPFRKEDGKRNLTWRNPLLSEKAPPRYPIISPYSNIYTHMYTYKLSLSHVYIFSCQFLSLQLYVEIIYLWLITSAESCYFIFTIYIWIFVLILVVFIIFLSSALPKVYMDLRNLQWILIWSLYNPWIIFSRFTAYRLFLNLILFCSVIACWLRMSEFKSQPQWQKILKVMDLAYTV